MVSPTTNDLSVMFSLAEEPIKWRSSHSCFKCCMVVILCTLCWQEMLCQFTHKSIIKGITSLHTHSMNDVNKLIVVTVILRCPIVEILGYFFTPIADSILEISH